MKVGIDLGGSHIGIGVVNSQNKIVEKTEKRLTNVEKKDIKFNIEKFTIDTIKKLKEKYEISSIGMAVPGTVIENCIMKSVNLGIKDKYDLKQIIESKLRIPVIIRNDAKCAALAENKSGCLRGKKRALFLTLGTGIGGAVIIENKLLNTGKYPGTEIGHMIIEKDGRKCNCGKKGCFETYSSMKVLKNRLRSELGFTEKTRGEELLQMIRNNKKVNAKTHEEKIRYEKIENTIQEFIEYLAIGISNLVNIFEPEAIGIGGSFVFFQDVLLERLKKEILHKNLLFNKRDEIEIMPAILGNDAGIIGATI